MSGGRTTRPWIWTPASTIKRRRGGEGRRRTIPPTLRISSCLLLPPRSALRVAAAAAPAVATVARNVSTAAGSAGSAARCAKYTVARSAPHPRRGAASALCFRGSSQTPLGNEVSDRSCPPSSPFCSWVSAPSPSAACLPRIPTPRLHHPHCVGRPQRLEELVKIDMPVVVEVVLAEEMRQERALALRRRLARGGCI